MYSSEICIAMEISLQWHASAGFPNTILKINMFYVLL